MKKEKCIVNLTYLWRASWHDEVFSESRPVPRENGRQRYWCLWRLCSGTRPPWRRSCCRPWPRTRDRSCSKSSFGPWRPSRWVRCLICGTTTFWQWVYLRKGIIVMTRVDTSVDDEHRRGWYYKNQMVLYSLAAHGLMYSRRRGACRLVRVHCANGPVRGDGLVGGDNNNIIFFTLLNYIAKRIKVAGM